MIRVGGEPFGGPGDVEFCGLIYPEGDEISKHMAARLQSEPHYQHDKLAQALAITKHRRVAIDCGAWVGGWSRELAKHFSQVLAIEANPDNARCLRLNVEASRNVMVLNAGVGEKSARAFVGRESDGPNVGSFISDQANGPRINVLPLDEILAAFETIQNVDYIKVHVNGMELKALRGAVRIIARHKPVLTVVLKPAIETYGDTADAARSFLSDQIGYRAAGGERPYEIWVPK